MLVCIVNKAMFIFNSEFCNAVIKSFKESMEVNIDMLSPRMLIISHIQSIRQIT